MTHTNFYSSFHLLLFSLPFSSPFQIPKGKQETKTSSSSSSTTILNIESSMATDTLFPMEGFEPSSHEELHVLAVDDSLVDRKVIERLLKISACKVTAVDSARRALQYLGLDGDATSVDGFNALKVNLIITDYWMPGMTGYELLKKIKESSAFKEIPVVIMSSENVLPRINKCLEEGAEEFIVKPVKLSDVRRLKDSITREEVEEEHKIKGTNKRKLDVSFSSPLDLSSSSSSSSQLTSLSSASSLDLDASSPLDVSALSSSSSSSSTSSSSTSSPMSSPSRRLKISDENNNYSD